MSTRTTFHQLVEHHGQVRIPTIQRDYAQGRKEQQIVRDDFIKALHGALCLSADDPALPLDLDFVYGSVVDNAFQPLDGQQRLTTLFLMHWYLAWTDGRGDDFRSRFVENGRSRFSYKVRPTSGDFIDAFANYTPGIPAADVKQLPSELIKDRPWYFRNWRLDPTIRSALTMLDRMHEVFRGTSGLYGRLTDDERPAITFQLLDLERFNLSDDLYIKMNARGKSLTPFETFKARFKRHLENGFEDVCADLRGSTPIVEFFSERIDNRWSEFFWRSRDRNTATFDAAAMNLLRTVIMVTRAPTADVAAMDLADLRSSTHPSSYTLFLDRGWLDREMVAALVTLLERWSAGPDPLRCYLPDVRHFDERDIWEKIVRSASLTFQEVVQFAGYVQYLVHARGEIDSAAFGAWMRVVYNLAANTDYNRPDDLQRSLSGLWELRPGMDSIIQHLAGLHGDVAGFFRPDLVAEERIKAHLITLGDGWPERISRAEGHDYFRGQIGFLLHICGVDLNDPAAEIKRLDAAAEPRLRADFERYVICAERMFDNIVKDAAGHGRLWERALLATGDFLPQLNRNRSLLKNTRTDPWSWKRFLRNAAAKESKVKVLKDLWDRLGRSDDFERDLAVISTTHGIDAWRAAIITTPSIYGYMEHGMLRFPENGGIYPLKKLQMNGRHAELFTYCLYEDLKAASEPPSFTVGYRETSSTDDEPSLVLSRHIGGLDVTFHLDFGGNPDVYKFYLHAPPDPESALEQVLVAEGFAKEGGQWRRILDRSYMKAAVLSLDNALP